MRLTTRSVGLKSLSYEARTGQFRHCEKHRLSWRGDATKQSTLYRKKEAGLLRRSANRVAIFQTARNDGKLRLFRPAIEMRQFVSGRQERSGVVLIPFAINVDVSDWIFNFFIITQAFALEIFMGDLINLKKVRKRRDKTVASKTAELNRIKFGRPKAERDRIEAETAKAAKTLDQHALPKGTST